MARPSFPGTDHNHRNALPWQQRTAEQTPSCFNFLSLLKGFVLRIGAISSGSFISPCMGHSIPDLHLRGTPRLLKLRGWACEKYATFCDILHVFTNLSALHCCADLNSEAARLRTPTRYSPCPSKLHVRKRRWLHHIVLHAYAHLEGDV